jgi:hypothetical protein
MSCDRLTRFGRALGSARARGFESSHLPSSLTVLRSDPSVRSRLPFRPRAAVSLVLRYGELAVRRRVRVTGDRFASASRHLPSSLGAAQRLSQRRGRRMDKQTVN